MTDIDNDTDRHAGDDWRTIAEAATALGKSTRTIRRYVAQGKLEADKSESPMLVNVADMTDKLADKRPTRVDKWRTEIDNLEARIQELEAEAQGLRAKVDRLAADNDRLEAANDRLQDVLDQVQSERDYLRQAHAASLSTQQKLLEAQTGRRSWIERLLPWTRGGENE
jgi:regulator of replication initiation timing